MLPAKYNNTRIVEVLRVERMPPPTEMPKYVWKIVPDDPRPIGDGLPVSDLDRKDGFLHLSTAEQVQLFSTVFFFSV